MRNEMLTGMVGLGLIVAREGERYSIVSRNREWLEEKGILQYEDLPLSNRAISSNTGQDFLLTQVLNPNVTGVEISRAKYDELLEMPYEEGDEGLQKLFDVAEQSQTVEPIGPPLTPAMCEVYVRLEKLFPDKDRSWRKTESVLYFGKAIG